MMDLLCVVVVFTLPEHHMVMRVCLVDALHDAFSCTAGLTGDHCFLSVMRASLSVLLATEAAVSPLALGAAAMQVFDVFACTFTVLRLRVLVTLLSHQLLHLEVCQEVVQGWLQQFLWTHVCQVDLWCRTLLANERLDELV